MNTTELFEKVGGREKAAALCGVTEWATHKWDENGIPSKHWQTFAGATSLGLEEIASVQPVRPRGGSEGEAA